jgi:hypothetical protein
MRKSATRIDIAAVAFHVRTSAMGRLWPHPTMVNGRNRVSDWSDLDVLRTRKFALDIIIHLV